MQVALWSSVVLQVEALLPALLDISVNTEKKSLLKNSECIKSLIVKSYSSEMGWGLHVIVMSLLQWLCVSSFLFSKSPSSGIACHSTKVTAQLSILLCSLYVLEDSLSMGVSVYFFNVVVTSLHLLRVPAPIAAHADPLCILFWCYFIPLFYTPRFRETIVSHQRSRAGIVALII